MQFYRRSTCADKRLAFDRRQLDCRLWNFSNTRYSQKNQEKLACSRSASFDDAPGVPESPPWSWRRWERLERTINYNYSQIWSYVTRGTGSKTKRQNFQRPSQKFERNGAWFLLELRYKTIWSSTGQWWISWGHGCSVRRTNFRICSSRRLLTASRRFFAYFQ